MHLCDDPPIIWAFECVETMPVVWKVNCLENMDLDIRTGGVENQSRETNRSSPPALHQPAIYRSTHPTAGQLSQLVVVEPARRE